LDLEYFSFWICFSLVCDTTSESATFQMTVFFVSM
jgi:hypothetical protein